LKTLSYSYITYSVGVFPLKEKLLLQNNSIQLFKELGCSGVSRFDMIINDKGHYYLENNTCPGFNLKRGGLPKLLKSAGYSLEIYLEYMIKTGLNKKKLVHELLFQ
jgi:D-alanine-D-alanine ligase-like ATP-grasp enzyme